MKLFKNAKNKIYNVFKKATGWMKLPLRKPKKLTKIERQEAKRQRNHAIMGIVQLLVVVSIAYSTAVILIGVDGVASKIALLPQVVFALTTLIKAFSKLYK